ncbi:MAG: SDR family oxidoreductase [Chloroflexota bacterium]
MSGIVVVTGGNRGIGLEVCRQLADLDYTVILGSRSLAKGEQAAAGIKSQQIIPHQLDVSDPDSINDLQAWVAAEFGVLDALINNAAIHYDTWQRASNADLGVVQEAFETNVYGPWRLCQVFLPLLRKSRHPRIVNVSSGSGSILHMGSGTPAYSISKVSLNALTRMLADEWRRDRILVNAVCPGWVATDMGGAGGRHVSDGAKGIVWAVTLPDNGPTGGFFRDEQPVDW